MLFCQPPLTLARSIELIHTSESCDSAAFSKTSYPGRSETKAQCPTVLTISSSLVMNFLLVLRKYQCDVVESAQESQSQREFLESQKFPQILLGVARTVKCRCHRAASYSFAAERQFGKTGCFVQNFKVRSGL